MEDQRFFDVYVFGDQTYDIQIKDLRSLIHDGNADPIVVEFLERVRRQLRNDLCQLSLEDRRHAPSFARTTDFLLWKKRQCVPVDMAILCLYQLGSFMRQDDWTADTMGLWALVYYRQVGFSYPSPSNSCCLGLCTGALAAAAVSCSSNTLELLPLAVEAVRLAFRIGMLVDKMARCIEPWNCDAKINGKPRNDILGDTFDTGVQQSAICGERLPWTFLVTDSEVDAALCRFNEDYNLPSTGRPWISARSTGDTVAVSGRPSSLARFLEWRQSCKPKQRNPRPLQIFAPYHAPHLYTLDDIENVVQHPHNLNGQSEPSEGCASKLRIPLISSSTGNIVQATDHHIDFRAALELAVEQILLQPIRWDPVLAALKVRLERVDGNPSLRVFPVATTADQLIYTGLQQQHLSTSLSGMAPRNKSLEWPNSSRSTSTLHEEKIAIIGMAGRFPEAANTDALWDILRLGIDVRKEVPPLRWDAKTHVDPSGRRKNSSRTALGCWLNDPDVFDAQFFGISAQEAIRMDPAQRLALMTTYEAFEQAGIVWPSGIDGASAMLSPRPDRVGVYYGVAGNDWRECNAAQKVDSHFMRASNRSFISGRISEVFKLAGPSLTLDASSSSSLAPVQIACRSLCSQETDICIVGGAHIMTNPDVHAGFDKAGVLYHSGDCKAFDETANGFCRGEGVVSLVLKRLEDAVADNDTILGVIAGTAANYNLQSPAGDSEPAHGTFQNNLFTEVLNRSNVDPETITYVEMGGPSTNIEDVSQVANALNILAPESISSIATKRRKTPVYFGSTMANIGHGETTSGLSSIIKVLLMLRENAVPPYVGRPIRGNSKFPGVLSYKYDTHVNAGKIIKWEIDTYTASQDDRRRALIHDEGTIARASSALLLEEKPIRNQERHKSSTAESRELDPSVRHIIAVSAKSKPSLRRNMANLYFWLKNEATRDRFTLAQISYTTTARRNHYPHRIMLVASSVEEVCTQLCAELQHSRVQLDSVPRDLKPVAATDQSNVDHPIVFAFTTYNSPSSSSIEYFRQLYENFSQVKGDMNHLEQIVKRLGLPSVMDALGLTGGNELKPRHRREASPSCNYTNTYQSPEPHGSVYTQAALRLGLPSVMSFCGVVQGPHQLAQAQAFDNSPETHQMAEQLAHMCLHVVMSRLWRSWGINPTALITEGDVSIFSALNVAGVLSDADAIYLAAAYIQLGLMQQIDKTELGYRGDWDAIAAAEFERLDRVTTYHKANIPILKVITAKERNGRFSSPRLGVLSAANQDNQMFLTRQVLPNMEPRNHDSKPAGLPAIREDLITACRASDTIPDQSIIQFMGPEPPEFLNTTSDCISNGPSLGDDTRPRSTAEEEKVSQAQSKIQMWSHLTETLRKFYHAGANIRWHQYYIDVPPRSRKVISTLPAYSWDLKEYWVPYINDWTLHKGDAPKPTVVPKLESTTIHTIVEETEIFETEGDRLRLVVEADISRHDLHGIVQGHVVDGVPLCTPSVYSDIALSLGKYIQQRYHHGSQERLINIKDMTVTKALIAQPSGPQMLRAHVEADWDSNVATCKFTTVDRHAKTQQHAQCTIMFSNTDILEHIKQFDMAGSYSKLVQALRQGISAHRTVRFTRNMMYRMISSLAEFHPDHKLVEDIVLDSQTHEATALVSFGQLLAEDGKHTGAFHTHPGVVDALTQPAGFALNGADTTDLDKEVYINHGWGSFYLFEPLELNKAYNVYVHMTEGDGHIWYGDIVVLDMGDNDDAARVVALFERYSVQRMPRRVLSVVLRAEGGGAYKNAKAQSGEGRQNRVDPQQNALPQPAQPETISPSSTLVSPAQEFEQPLRPARTSSVTTSGLHERGHQNLRIKVGIPPPTAGPPTPLTAKALSMNNEMLKSLRAHSDSGCEVVKRSLQIISEESGYELADIDDDKLALADLGVDSLLSLAITSRFREELGDSVSHLDLNTLFMTCHTVASLKAALAGNKTTPNPRNVHEWRAITTDTASIPVSPPESICTQDFSIVSTTHIKDPPVPQATSVILQGSPKRARATIFLFPDGSGSATSYASIPPICPTGDICVIAFNCPFLKKESSMFSCPLDALIDQGYLPELHRRLELRATVDGNTKHTYYVGGWSAGGTLAYRAAQRLLQNEDEVKRGPRSLGILSGLVLIDAPPPIKGMDPLPDHFYKYCEQKGVFGGWSGPRARKAPDWLIPHFNGTIAVLQHYVAEPLTRAQAARLKTVACIWAGESVVGSDKPLEPHPDDTEGMKFLTVQRTDFSTAGWEQLVPGVDQGAILCQRLEGAHHFSLTRTPYSAKLAVFIRRAMSMD